MTAQRRSSRPQRPGPRPLPLHLTLSLSSWLSSPVGLMLSANSWMPGLKLNPELQSLAQNLLQQNPGLLGPALAQATSVKLNKLLEGIERYQLHPYRRDLKEPDAIWQEGSTRLLDYGGKGELSLFVPSLINKAHVLDLDTKRSLLRYLRTQGIRPLLLDWGTPGQTESTFDINAYVSRLQRAIKAMGKKLHLVGYCMGGNIALAAACANSAQLKSLTLLATPWDFHADNKAASLRSAALYKMWRPACETMGELPVDLIQTLFTLLDPLGPQQKFMRLAELDDASEVESFVALEDWLNDGIALPLGVADNCLLEWYDQNALAEGEWIDPSGLELPALVVIPDQDKIVSPASAEALATALPQCMRRRVPLGHVGMIVSRNARQHVWEPLAKWITGNR